MASSPISLGTTLLARDFGHVAVTETAHAPAAALPLHYHATTNVAVVLAGGFSEKIGRRTYHVERFGALLQPAGVGHTDLYDETPTTSVIVEVRQPEWTRSLGEVVHRSRTEAVRIATQLRLSLRTPDALGDLATEGLALQLLNSVVHGTAEERESGGAPLWLRRVREYLDDHAGAPPTLQELGRVAAVHPHHVDRAFKRHFGTTPAAYLRQRRLQQALALLRESPQPLAEIAATLGFTDQSHFTNVVRDATGLTPSRYRAAFR